MPSENKKRKLKNSHCVPSELKNKKTRLKRLCFYTPSLRRVLKKVYTEEVGE
jgi:hypothetical protein